jgi:hypothetical protein
MTLRILVWTTLLTGLSANLAAAQTPQPPASADATMTLPAGPDQQTPPPPQTPKPSQRPPTLTPPAEPPVTLAPPRKARGRDLNLQVELTISDQLGTQAPEKKVVSMLVADGTFGRIRATADAQRTGVGMVGTGLNVDARPTVLENDRILLELTVEYTPFRESGQVPQRPTILHESLSVILQSGKAMIVSQAADPVTDRKMSVEVRASIMK